jgi:hypothetical protein
VAGGHGEAGDAIGRADEAAGNCGRTQSPALGNRDRIFRFRDEYRMVGATHQGETRTDVLLFRQPGDNTLGQIKWEQMVFLGNPEYGCDLQPIDFAAFARACGGQGYTIEDPARCGAILDEAMAVRGPVLIEAVVDPFEPTMPPKVTLDQTVKFAKSLAKGEPNRKKIAATIAEDKIREMV